MARDYARIRVSINGDDEFEALSADAQWLYTRVLLTDPTLSACGVADWRPVRLTVKADDMTLQRLVRAAAELECERFILVNLDTEEVLVRTYIRNDELLRNPKMAAAVLKAYAAVASKNLRAAIVTEIKRVRSESPDYSSWTYKDTAAALSELVTRPDLDVVGYTNAYPVQNGYTDAVPIANGITNRNGNRDPSTDYQSDNQSDSVPIPCNLQPSTYSPQPKGLGNRGTSPEPTTLGPNDPPPTRCPKHPDGTSEPCGACADARRAREDADRANREWQRAQHEAEQQAAHETKRAAVAVCDLCDDDGYRGAHVCDHVERSSIAKAGVARARAALEKPSAAAKLVTGESVR